MSHFSKIDVEIKDEEALKAATNKMGLTLIPNGMCRHYFGAERADLVIKLPGKYDVALNKRNHGFEMKADLYQGQVSRYIGSGAGLLMQQYAVEKAKMEAFKKALAVSESKEGSDIVLLLTDYETGGQVKIVCHVGGKIDVKTEGFPGQSCMKFQDLESALGSVESFEPTMEMYEAEPIFDKEHVNNFID